MSYCMFRCDKDPNLIAYTRDRSGSCLPADVGPWYCESTSLIPVAGELGNDIMREVSERGYILLRSG